MWFLANSPGVPPTHSPADLSPAHLECHLLRVSPTRKLGCSMIIYSIVQFVFVSTDAAWELYANQLVVEEFPIRTL